jgi:hypothetical protein
MNNPEKNFREDVAATYAGKDKNYSGQLYICFDNKCKAHKAMYCGDCAPKTHTDFWQQYKGSYNNPLYVGDKKARFQ